MRCPRCGREVPLGARFCPYCGAALDHEVVEEIALGPHPMVLVFGGIVALCAGFFMLMHILYSPLSSIVPPFFYLFIVLFIVVALVMLVLGLRGKTIPTYIARRRRYAK